MLEALQARQAQIRDVLTNRRGAKFELAGLEAQADAQVATGADHANSCCSRLQLQLSVSVIRLPAHHHQHKQPAANLWQAWHLMVAIQLWLLASVPLV